MITLYRNRKLYHGKAYITLDEAVEYIQKGERVIYQPNKMDRTQEILARALANRIVKNPPSEAGLMRALYEKPAT